MRATLLRNLSWFLFPVQEFRLYDRAMHVYSEAGRVEEFKSICDLGEAGSSARLGALMNASHDSLSQLYQCSCTELDDLVNICRYGFIV